MRSASIAGRTFPITVLISILISIAGWSPRVLAVEPREWTVMVYLCADNNLDELGLDNLQEMADAGSTANRSIVALLDRFNAPATEYVIEGRKAVVLRERGELNMGDPAVLTGFVQDTIARYPAQHYALILFNHGTGWRNRSDGWRGIAYDDSSGDHLSTAELQTVTADIARHLGRNLDLLGFDACLMQMIEVAYAVRQSVDHVVGSEELEPQYGYPYDSILKALISGMSPGDLARTIVRKYENFYSTRSSKTAYRPVKNQRDPEGTTQSAIKCSRLNDLRASLDAVCAELMKGDHIDRVQQAIARAQRFCTSTHADLGDFLVALKQADNPAPELDVAIDTALRTLNETVLANAVTQNDASGDWGGESRRWVRQRPVRA